LTSIKKNKNLKEYQARTATDGFWNDNIAAQKIIQQINERKEWLDAWNVLDTLCRDTKSLIEMAEEAQETSFETEIKRDIDKLHVDIENLELKNMLSGPDDEKNAFLTIHSGAGGTEAQDWAEMLLRMYSRWCERHGLKIFLADMLEGEGAGIKSATIEVIW